MRRQKAEHTPPPLLLQPFCQSPTRARPCRMPNQPALKRQPIGHTRLMDLGSRRRGGQKKKGEKRHGFDSARGGLFSLQRNRGAGRLWVGRTGESLRSRRISLIHEPVHCPCLGFARFAHTHSQQVRPRDAMRGAFPGSRPRPWLTTWNMEARNKQVRTN